MPVYDILRNGSYLVVHPLYGNMIAFELLGIHRSRNGLGRSRNFELVFTGIIGKGLENSDARKIRAISRIVDLHEYFEVGSRLVIINESTSAESRTLVISNGTTDFSLSRHPVDVENGLLFRTRYQHQSQGCDEPHRGGGKCFIAKRLG